MNLETYSTIYQFFMPEGDPALSILRADEALYVASCGDVRRTLPTRAERRARGFAGDDHLLSEPIFGPTRDGSCLCGAVEGQEGVTCRRCGVVCGPSALRAERFGHVEVPCGFVHPELAELIANLLGEDEDEVLRTHPQRLRSALRQVRLSHGGALTEAFAAGYGPADLILTRVPVVPPRDRPTGALKAFDDDRWFIAHTAHLHLDPASAAYQELLNASPYRADAPWFEASDVERLNNAVVELCWVLTRAVGSKARRFKPPKGWKRFYPVPGLLDALSGNLRARPTLEPPEDDAPRSDGDALAFADDGGLVVQRGGELLHMSWPEGALLGRAPAPGQLIAMQRGVALLQATPQPDPDRGNVLRGVYGFLPAEERWHVGRWPEGARAVFPRSRSGSKLTLFDATRGRVSPELSDAWGLSTEAHIEARSPCGRFMLIDGHVFDLDEGAPLFHVETCEPPAGASREEALDVHALNAGHARWPQAFVRCPGDDGAWRWLTQDGWLVEDGHCLYRLTAESLATAFSQDGAHLGTLTATELLVLRVNPFELVAKLNLDTLHPPPDALEAQEPLAETAPVDLVDEAASIHEPVPEPPAPEVQTTTAAPAPEPEQPTPEVELQAEQVAPTPKPERSKPKPKQPKHKHKRRKHKRSKPVAHELTPSDNTPAPQTNSDAPQPKATPVSDTVSLFGPTPTAEEQQATRTKLEARPRRSKDSTPKKKRKRKGRRRRTPTPKGMARPSKKIDHPDQLDFFDYMAAQLGYDPFGEEPAQP